MRQPAALLTSNVSYHMPPLTYKNQFASLPLSATMVSDMLLPLQAGSWLMSILAGLGTAPPYVAVPLTVAAVAGSIGVEAVFASLAAEVACSSLVFSFLLQPTSSANAKSQSSPSVAARFVVSTISPFL